MPQPETRSALPLRMSFAGFVALIASLMAMNALAIDAMLPALPDIGADLRVVDHNARQWVVTAYMLGFGCAQLAHGTLSDRFGRRPVLLVGLVGYVVFSLLATLSPSFAVLIAARAAQGTAAAAARVVAVSIVRDCFAGRTMARVMSLAFLVFLLVPILAPAAGSLILLVAPWRWIFAMLAGFGAVVLVVVVLRLPETLAPENRRAINVAAILSAWGAVIRDRSSVGYTLALTFTSGGLMSFVTSAQQISAEALGRAAALPVIFASIGSAMAIGSLLNSRIVERLGTRLVSHSALIGMTCVALVHLGWTLWVGDSILSFVAFQAATMFCFSLCGSNFGAMAMENVGHVAGAAASLQGFTSTVGGAVIGFLVGQAFDGTTVPMTTSFAVFGSLTLLVVLVTERGRLFRAHHAAPVRPSPGSA